MFSIKISVYLKKEIHDPQSQVILNEFYRQGLQEIVELKQGKVFLLSFTEAITTEKMDLIKNLASNFLSNPVLEEYSVEIINES